VSRGRQNMALASLNPGPLLSFTPSRRSQRFCDIARSVEVSQGRVHRLLGRCGMQGLNVSLVLHRCMNKVQVEQPWRRSSPLALHGCHFPSKLTILHCRGAAAGADDYHAWFHGSVDGNLPQKESRNTDMACHAQVHSEPWNMDDEALPALEMSSLSQRGIAHTGGSQVR
jgi:hypothetical protein